MNRAAKLCLVATFFAVCGAAALFQAGQERRRSTTPPQELYAVVWQQLTAFRVDDYATAYRQVSLNFQEKYPAETFAQLARVEYPGLVRAERLEFGATHFAGRRAQLPAYFFLREGDVLPCLYLFVWEDNGWKIDGVRVLKRWPPNRRLGGTRT